MNLMRRARATAALTATIAATLLGAHAAIAQFAPRTAAVAAAPVGPPFSATYADLADLADSAPLVVRAEVRKLVRVEDARAPGLRSGWGRFLIAARTQALLTGSAPLGQDLTFLADLPLDPRGRPPVLKKRVVFAFARPVAGRPAELALVAPDAFYLWSAGLETQLRAILTATLASDAPARITGVREIIHVPGNLVGEGETQVFLITDDGSAASLTIQHRPDQPVRWGASFSELTAELGNPPRRDTLGWYRLACFLPNTPPRAVNHSETASARAQAENDYRMVLGELGVCEHQRLR